MRFLTKPRGQEFIIAKCNYIVRRTAALNPFKQNTTTTPLLRKIDSPANSHTLQSSHLVGVLYCRYLLSIAYYHHPCSSSGNRRQHLYETTHCRVLIMQHKLQLTCLTEVGVE